MNNPIEMILRNIMNRGSQYGQMYARQLLQNNPQVAQKLQGQDLHKLGRDGLRQAGIDPNTFMGGMFGGR